MVRPPFDVSPGVLGALEALSRMVGRFEGLSAPAPQPVLRKENRIRTVHGSVAIEGNTLSLEQVTAVLEGRVVVGDPKEIREVQNAITAYEVAPRLHPGSERDLLRAHRLLMQDLIPDAGRYRTGGVGVLHGTRVAHVAPPAKRVPSLVKDLLRFVDQDRRTPLVLRACVAHYELEFIHPFSDGNGRVGRLWQQVALCRVSPLFTWIPVESVIRARQQAYYDALGRSDKGGNCTPFLEFALTALCDALEDFLDRLRPGPATLEQRLARAKETFGGAWFSRRDYLGLHKALSTATASRDLRQGLDLGALERRGEKALAEYRFGPPSRRRRPGT